MGARDVTRQDDVEALCAHEVTSDHVVGEAFVACANLRIDGGGTIE